MMKLIQLFICTTLMVICSMTTAQTTDATPDERQEISVTLSKPLAKLREKSLPFCRRYATVDMWPIAAKEITAPVRLALFWPNGIAEVAQISASDSLVAVNDQAVIGKSSSDFQEKIWQVAKEQSAQTGKPMKLRLKSSISGTDQEREVFVKAKWVCGGFTAGIDIKGLADLKITMQKHPELSIPDFLIMRQTRDLALESLDAQSTGKTLSTMGAVLNIIGGNPSDRFSSLQTRYYTDNDYLKADALAMMLLHISGQPIDRYIRWTVTESMSVAGFLKVRREYDESAKKKLKEVQDAILAGEPLRAASIVVMKLDSAQEKIINNLNSTTVTTQTPEGINAELRRAYLPTNFATLEDVSAVPIVSNECRSRYAQWMKWPNPKGFAISETGSCGFSTSTKPPKPDLPTDPAERALEVCSKQGAGRCQLYAIDDNVVWKGREGINQELRKTYLPTNFAVLEDISAVPIVSDECRGRYAQWLKWPNPKGFAIGEKGSCGFSTTVIPPRPGLPTDPAERALEVCSKQGAGRCQLYAIDDKVVWKGQY